MGRSFLIAVLMSSLAACAAEETGTELGPDAAVEEPDAEIIGSVDLNIVAPDATTPWGSIPIKGNGPPNGTLRYTTPGGGQFTEQLTSSGAFCVNVILQQDTLNTIKFEAVDPIGTYSDPVLVDVLQDGEPPNSVPGPDPKPEYSNILNGAGVSAMSVEIEEGTVEALVDGDSSAHVSIRNAKTTLDWIVLDLNERLPIQQFNIQTTQDCPMESYRILLSDDAQGDPIVWSWWPEGNWVYGDGWTMVANIDDATKAKQEIEPTLGSPLARRMAIQFLSADCGPYVGSGRHRITELEVWAQGESDDGETQKDEGPSCATN